MSVYFDCVKQCDLKLLFQTLDSTGGRGGGRVGVRYIGQILSYQASSTGETQEGLRV